MASAEGHSATQDCAQNFALHGPAPSLCLLAMASTDVDDRRMVALRDGFVRALEGATGACGFEARALRPWATELSTQLTRRRHRSLRRATRTCRPSTTTPCLTSTARHVLQGPRSAVLD